MKNLFLLLAGLTFFSSVFATNNVPNSGNYNPGLSTTPNSNLNAKPGFYTNPVPKTTIDNSGMLGNGGNTQGVGTDNGGGNGPSH